MTIPSPKLDDRDFNQLMAEAVAKVQQTCPQWSDLSPGDPGIALLEAFAYLTESLGFRLNRLPEKNYIALLNLLGVTRHPPTAATVRLTFFRTGDNDTGSIHIPSGTEVTTKKSSEGREAPVFVTLESVVLQAGQSSVTVLAQNSVLIEAELIGRGTGLPGQSVHVSQAPIIAPMIQGTDIVLGVETAVDAIDTLSVGIEYEGKSFRIWQQVPNFTNMGQQTHVYRADYFSGCITFAPALRLESDTGALSLNPEALAAVPEAGREIRCWYRTGGGTVGNVRANTLVTMKQPVEGLAVTNAGAAIGGGAEESLDNMLVRGPLSLHSLERAVTARDYELIATRSSGAVNRARAYTDASLWAHGTPGTVNIQVVPSINEQGQRARKVTADLIQEFESPDVLEQVQNRLDERRPLGTSCQVGWASYKTVEAHVTLTLHRQEDSNAVEQRVISRLNQLISPVMSSPERRGWPFGRPLTSWDVLKCVGSEPAVATVNSVRLKVLEVPDKDISILSIDAFQKDTWYTASRDSLFRSGNNGTSWERIQVFSGRTVVQIKAYPIEAGLNPDRAGLLALVVLSGEQSELFVSWDCGETVASKGVLQFIVDDITWVFRNNVPVLMFVSESGLFELTLQEGASIVQILVDPQQPTLGFKSIATSCNMRGQSSVALAAYNEAGIYLSVREGQNGSFEPIGLDGELLSVLMVQHIGPHCYLWAGTTAPGRAAGHGCFRLRIGDDGPDVDGWASFSQDWSAGSCRSLCSSGSRIYAGSLRLGVLCLDTADKNPRWQAPDVACGLPLRDVGRLQPINTVMASEQYVIAGGPNGLYRSNDQSGTYHHCSSSEFEDQVALPPTWVFCSGEHQIVVGSTNE